MIYCGELSKLNAYIEITARINYQELNMIGISTQTFDFVAAQHRSEIVEGKPVKVMFFNAQFASYETRVLSDMLGKLIFTIILMGASIFGIIWSFTILNGS